MSGLTPAELRELKGWLLQRRHPSSGSLLLLLPNEIKNSEADQLAQSVNAKLISLENGRGGEILGCCSVWGGIDNMVKTDGFADEQTVGFILQSLIDRLDQGPVVIALSPESVWNCDDVTEKVSKWLNLFGVESIEVRTLADSRLLFRGIKQREQDAKKCLALGVVLKERKRHTLLTESFLKRAKTHGIEFSDRSSQADVVLMKIDPRETSLSLPKPWENAKVVDHLDHVRILNNRKVSSELARVALEGLRGVFIPEFSVVKASVASFPVLAKPNDAADHLDLWLINDRASLDKLDPGIEWFFQKCIDHAGLVFKVSVIGTDVSLARRPSAVDFSQLQLGKGPMKLGRRGDLHPRKSVKTSTKAVLERLPVSNSLPFHVARDIALRLQRCFGLTLFGFDLLLEAGTQAVYLVDINYFPSFVDVPGRDELIIRTLKALLNS